MSRTEILIAALIVTLGVTGVIWFLSTHEQFTEQAWTGYRGEARRNPWLAAQRLLDRFERPAAELRSLPELRDLPQHATVVIPRDHFTITSHLRDQIIQWVNRGGYLVVEAEVAQQDDRLVDALGVQRLAIEQNNGAQRATDQTDEEKNAAFDVIRLPDAASPARVRLRHFLSLEAVDAQYRATGKYGTYLLVKRSGKGAVAVINDLDFARNNAIGKLDHAQFVLDLVSMRDNLVPDTGASQPADEKTIMFFNQPGKPSLIAWLRTNAWAPMSAATLAILLWLWRVVPRFGPVMPDAQRDRRRLLDHLRASGRFLWTNGHANRLLEASREACLRQLARSLPQFLSTPPEARPELLKRTLGITGEHAQRILQPQNGGNLLQFWQTIRLYQRVYTLLGAGTSALGSKARRTS